MGAYDFHGVHSCLYRYNFYPVDVAGHGSAHRLYTNAHVGSRLGKSGIMINCRPAALSFYGKDVSGFMFHKCRVSHASLSLFMPAADKLHLVSNP